MIIQINDDIIKLKDKSIVIFDEETKTIRNDMAKVELKQPIVA